MTLTPFLLFATIQILPTHDDWVGTTSPDFTPFFTKEHFLFYGYHWRPFDTWIGYIVGRNPQFLFPFFNHICVIIGHFICSLLIYRLLIILDFNRLSSNVTTLFFFITPATMATVLAVDSQNQIYALIWDILAFISYITKKYKYLLWPLFVFIATLSKENGLMWALICPILAYGFDFVDKKTLKRDSIIGIIIILFYFLAIALLPKNMVIHPEYVPDSLKIVKNIIKFFFSSFITVDYIYLLHQPKQNILLAALTLSLCAPFMYVGFIRQLKHIIQKKTLCIIICMFIAVTPHLVTVFSMMHTYGGLLFVGLLVACGINQCKNNKKNIIISFALYIVAAITINVHLIKESIASGLIGKKMAQEAIQKTKPYTKDVYLIIIEEDFEKLSSFCTIPSEAFGWGLAARHETNYQWPETIIDTLIERSIDYHTTAKNIAKEKLQKKQFDCVWIADHDNIEVINK